MAKTRLETQLKRAITGQLRSWLHDHPDAVKPDWLARPSGEQDVKLVLSIRKRVTGEVLAILREHRVLPPVSTSIKSE